MQFYVPSKLRFGKVFTFVFSRLMGRLYCMSRSLLLISFLCIQMSFKSGFVNIVGSPNVGKSTLLNAILGEKLSVITPKAQTTRHRILGIYNKPECQIVFSDTPGMLEPGYKLHENMMTYVSEAIEDADIIIFLTDVTQPATPQRYLDALNQTEIPVLCVINKMDEATPQELEALMDDWHQKLPGARIAPLSALYHQNVDMLLEEIKKLLPEHAPYYDHEEITDRPVRFFVSEIIREKILLNYGQEIPYSCEVVVESYKEEPMLHRIHIVIYIARNSQKPILIGIGGSKLKKVGTEARRDIEKLAGCKVFLDLRVKVKENWRDNERTLKSFGY